MEEMSPEDQRRSTVHSRPSLDSIQEISYNKEKLIRTTLILINIISLIAGIYILAHREFYLSPDYKFDNYRSLYVFLVIYTLGMIVALFLSFIIAVIAKLISYFRNKGRNNLLSNNMQNENSSNNVQYRTRITDFILNNNQNDIAIIPFTLSYFIAITIGLYFIALPYSFCLIISLLKNESYSKFITFFFLFFFLIINLLAGSIMIITLFYMIFSKRSGSVRKFEYSIDNDNVNDIRAQVKDAIKI